MKLCRASSVDCRLRRYCCVTSRALLAPDVTCSRTVRIIEALQREEDAMVRTRGMCLPQQSCEHAFAAMAFLDAIRPGSSALGSPTGWPWMGLPLAGSSGANEYRCAGQHSDISYTSMVVTPDVTHIQSQQNSRSREAATATEAAKEQQLQQDSRRTQAPLKTPARGAPVGR